MIDNQYLTENQHLIEIAAKLQRKHFTLDIQFNLTARVTGLFGPSGSGKSTILNIIAGLVKPDNGRVTIDGQCLLDTAQHIFVPVYQRQVGLVFQDSRLFPHLSINDNLHYGYHKRQPVQQQFQPAQIIDLLQIGHLLNQRPHQISGGEQQRVAIGRALLSSPKLLLLDEPLASLDERLKDQILPFLKKVANEIKIPMIYVSHDQQEVRQICEEIVFIDNGKLI